MTFPETPDGLEQQAAEQRAFLSDTYGATDDPTLRKRGVALWTLGEDLRRLGRFEDAAVVLDEAAATLAPFETRRYLVVGSRQRQAMALSELGRTEEALEVLNHLIELIGLEWTDPDLPDEMPLVLGLWMGLLRDTGFLDDSERVADVVLRRYRRGATPTQRLTLALALNQKGLSEILRGDFTEALVFLNDMVLGCSEEGSGDFEDEFLSLLVSGLVMRAFALEQSGRLDEAVTDYDAALARCGDASTADMERLRNDAQAGKTRIMAVTQSRRGGS